MPAANVTKQMGIGGSHIIGGSKGGPRNDANVYDAFLAIASDLINLRLAVSALVLIDGGGGSGVDAMPTQFLTVEV